MNKVKALQSTPHSATPVCFSAGEHASDFHLAAPFGPPCTLLLSQLPHLGDRVFSLLFTAEVQRAMQDNGP